MRKVISIGGPGLGDTLAYSTLPEELTKQHGHEVYISEPEQGWRNADVRMLWARNPYVAGIKSGEPQSDFVAYDPQTPARLFPSWTLAMENIYGCQPTNAHPRIYWKPRILDEHRGKIYADPSSFSQPFTGPVFDQYVRECAWQFGFDPREVIVIDSAAAASNALAQMRNGRESLRDNPRITVSGLEQYADVVASCRMFLGVESGGQAFASAVKGDSPTPIVIALFTAQQYNDRTFVFGNVHYKVTGQLTPDWLGHD